MEIHRIFRYPALFNVTSFLFVLRKFEIIGYKHFEKRNRTLYLTYVQLITIADIFLSFLSTCLYKLVQIFSIIKYTISTSPYKNFKSTSRNVYCRSSLIGGGEIRKSRVDEFLYCNSWKREILSRHKSFPRKMLGKIIKNSGWMEKYDRT